MLRYVLDVFVGGGYQTFVVPARNPDDALRRVLAYTSARGQRARSDVSREARLAAPRKRLRVTALPG